MAIVALATILALTAAALLAPAASADGHHKDDPPATGRLIVIKKVVPAHTAGKHVDGAKLAAGWTFSATTTTAGVGGLPATLTTGADGTVTFNVTFPKKTAKIDVTVAETQQPGFKLVTRKGANAVCRKLGHDHDKVPVVNDDATPGRPAFRIELPAKRTVVCVVVNRPVKTKVAVEKRWVINGQQYANGEQPAGFDATLTLTGPGDAGPTPQPWGEARGGYLQGESVTIDETVSIADPACSVQARQVTLANGAAVDAALPFTYELAGGLNTFTVTNRIVCQPLPPPPPPPPPPPVVRPPPPQGGVGGVTETSRPRLSVRKRASTRTVVAGNTVRFTIIVRNRGDATARRIRVCDRLPRDVTVLADGGGRMVAGGRVCWRIRQLGADRTTRRTLLVRVDRDARPGTIVNRVTVRGAGQRRTAQRRVRVVRPAPQPSVGGEQVTG